ncbi:MAG: hypothetical protein PHV34_17590 [Verrucomicrobiae bacterium]|nr:hypothetical protein [Verrucomicrobiae bacterium]
MQQDALLIVSDEQEITASVASTSSIQLNSQGADVGPGQQMFAVLSVDQAFNNLTSLKVDVQTDSDSAFGSAKTLLSKTLTRSDGDLALGKQHVLGAIPKGCEKYLQGYYTVDGSAPSTGKVSLELVSHIEANTPTSND